MQACTTRFQRFLLDHHHLCMSSKQVKVAVIDENPSTYESRHVHDVYDQIASHFSTTRYKPWPIISRFLSELPTGWVGLDSGTGNGKYLPLPLERPGAVCTIGLDRSRNLLEIAKAAGDADREVVWGDVLGRGWRTGAFDYVISIATIHHLATHERRQQAVERLLECVSAEHGRVLVYVWAIEQDDLSKRAIPLSSHDQPSPQPDQTAGQDVFVPWVLSQQQPRAKKPRRQRNAAAQLEEPEKPEPAPQTFHRYYHMFAEGELDALVHGAARSIGLSVGKVGDFPEGASGVEIVQSGWERSNYYVEARRWRR
ncbi:S-adenosyl-L-methionine-dependent methyltransferase [Peniophora sp. CONT]|nr:S-adenosyl-L-methionine-dependent methyltransferase [Peniophora sp. CONT]